MKRLGTLLLPDSLLWSDRYAWSPVAQNMARTLGGNTVVWSCPLTAGRPITLEAGEGSAFLDLTTVEALADMAQTPGAIFSLTWEEITLNVIFRHHEPPAMAFTPLWPNHDLFSGTLRLTQVE